MRAIARRGPPNLRLRPRVHLVRRCASVAAKPPNWYLRAAAASIPIGAVVFAVREHLRQPSTSWDSDDLSVTRAELERRYRFAKSLGRGGFGDVWLAHDVSGDRPVAIKVLSLEKLSRGMIEQEIAAMKRCGSHPNVVEFLQVVWVQPDSINEHGEAALVMEVAAGGGLFERLIAEGAYTEQLASGIVQQIARALYHLHSRGIVHRDIKPENVVFEHEAEDAPVKLIDFGTAAVLEADGAKVSGGGRIGTWSYWAPEQLAQQEYDFAVDMWSLGLVMFILLVGYHPFDPEGDASDQQILRNMRQGNISFDTEEWGSVSKQAQELVRSLLQPDASKRCTAAELITHPWVLGQDVPGEPMPKTQDRLRYFIQARHAFYGSIVMGLLSSHLSMNATAEGLGADGGEYDVMAEGWRLLDKEGKGHIDANDLRRVCLEMGYKVSEKDVEQMLLVMSPTSDSSNRARAAQPLSDGKGGTGGTGDGERLVKPMVSFERYRTAMQASFSRRFEKGQHVFREGDAVDAFYVITRGACEVRAGGPEGDRLIATLGPGDFFGETALVEGREKRNASVRCLSAVEVLVIDRGMFTQLAQPDSDSRLSGSIRKRAEARQQTRARKVLEERYMSTSLARQRQSHSKGSVIYQQGSVADHFYIVNSGELEMSCTTPEGHSVRVKTVKAGDHFGYDALLSSVHDTTVTCLSDVELTAVPQHELKLAFSRDQYLENTVKATVQARDRNLERAVKTQGEAQLLPMMARAAAAGGGVEYEKYEAMLSEMSPVALHEGGVVFYQGDVPESVYFCIEGALNCEYAADPRSEVPPRVVARLGPGDHFGETAMLEERNQRNVTVRCVSSVCGLRSMSIERFREVLAGSTQMEDTVRRAAVMRTNRRVRKVIEAAGNEDATIVHLRPGETLFRQGDRSGAFYVIESGEIEMTMTSVDDGKAVPLRRHRAGDCFGASGLISGDSYRRNTATAVSAVTLKAIPHTKFRVMLRNDAFLQAGLKASDLLHEKAGDARPARDERRGASDR